MYIYIQGYIYVTQKTLCIKTRPFLASPFFSTRVFFIFHLSLYIRSVRVNTNRMFAEYNKCIWMWCLYIPPCLYLITNDVKSKRREFDYCRIEIYSFKASSCEGNNSSVPFIVIISNSYVLVVFNLFFSNKKEGEGISVSRNFDVICRDEFVFKVAKYRYNQVIVPCLTDLSGQQGNGVNSSERKRKNWSFFYFV